LFDRKIYLKLLTLDLVLNKYKYERIHMNLKKVLITFMALFATVGFGLHSMTGAHEDPVDCTASGVGISLAAYRDNLATNPVGFTSVQPGEEIFFRTTLVHLGDPNCNFSEGDLSITTPDLVEHDVTPGGGIPLVEVGSPFVSDLVPYTVSAADVNGATLPSRTDYLDGESHSGDVHNVVGGFATLNVLFEDVNLEVTKTAVPMFNSECTWEITKTVDEDEHTLATDETGASMYEVTVSSDCEDTDFAVMGEITVHNPALSLDAVLESLEDVVSEDIVAEVDCTVDASFEDFPHTLAPGESLVCNYSADLPDAESRVNTATATTSGEVGGGEGMADVDFEGVEPTEVLMEEVTVEDSFAGELGTCNANEDDGVCSWEYERIFACTEDEGEHVNTATIVETGQEATANVMVTCTPDDTPDEFLGCTYTQGYWKTHSMTGPAPYDAGWAALGDYDTNGEEEEEQEVLAWDTTWYTAFHTPPKGGNVWYQLSHQWMAAYLNVANGADAPEDVADAMLEAKAWLHATDPATGPKANQFPEAGAWASLFASFNTGGVGPGHCSDVEIVE
jgi:hypothetical protein